MSFLTQFSSAPGIPAQLLIVAGGGGGAGTVNATSFAGSGGAGEVVYFGRALIQYGFTYAITIGGGGSGGTAVSNTLGVTGSNTLFDTVIAGGGGGGGYGNGNSGTRGIYSGGSGGGFGTGGSAAGSGFADYFLPISEFAPFYNSSFSNDGTGNSGGGASFAAGSSGVSLPITGASVVYGNGGVTSANNGAGANGTANTGSGGGGSRNAIGTGTVGGNGGSGIVVIAYQDQYPAATTITGTYNEPTRTGFRVYRFTASGSILF